MSLGRSGPSVRSGFLETPRTRCGEVFSRVCTDLVPVRVIRRVKNRPLIGAQLKGSEFLLEMLGHSRLRAPALAEFLKSAVDQVGRIQILHHLWPHDVVLG